MSDHIPVLQPHMSTPSFEDVASLFAPLFGQEAGQPLGGPPDFPVFPGSGGGGGGDYADYLPPPPSGSSQQQQQQQQQQSALQTDSGLSVLSSDLINHVLDLPYVVNTSNPLVTKPILKCVFAFSDFAAHQHC